MPEVVALLDPHAIDRNEENPRLIFHAKELEALQQSIASQGILVPLTVFGEGKTYRLLDGERRWRCALKLGLRTVPAIVQPKPGRLQNIMMMFAIHHARKDWDPLPTALKLKDLEEEFTRQQERKPSEVELAGLASLSRGEVRRLKKLLALPELYRSELLAELEKPRSEQTLTVDQVLEATTAASLLKKQDVVDHAGEDQLRRALIEKYKSGVVYNTVEPRKLARLARAVDRGEVSVKLARQVVSKLIRRPDYTIEEAFEESVRKVDFEHGIEQLAQRISRSLDEHIESKYEASESLREELKLLGQKIRAVLSLK